MENRYVFDRAAGEHKQRLITALVCFLGVWMIGLIDYGIGYRISLLVLYAVPVGLATIYAGPFTALLLAVLAITISRGGDLLAGMPYPGNAVFFTNVLIPLAFFGIMIGALWLLERIRKGLESTVEQRNHALLQEMTERGRLEHEVVELSEREHRRFGEELHDLVSQELAAIALDAHMLSRHLLSTDQAEATQARDIALKVDRALTRARNIARGYFTVGFDAAGLDSALREFAKRTEKTARIACAAHCSDNLAIGNEDAAVQLFRIAQEAVRNAVQHSGASRITINLERADDLVELAVEDDGRGLPAMMRKNKGLGLSIMAYRAGLIGGKFRMERPAQGGTRVLCRVPASVLARSVAASQPAQP